MTATCAICTAEIVDEPRREVIDGAIVAVCDRCTDESPRLGRYTFGGSATARGYETGCFGPGKRYGGKS